MTEKKLIAIEAMTLGVKRMADHAAFLGYQIELLADDPTMYVDREDTTVVKFPTRDIDALRSYIADNREEIGGIFSSTDTWGVTAAELREEFGFSSRISSTKLSRMRDKAWVQDQLEDGVSPDELNFPMIVKPRGGTGSTDIYLLENTNQRDQFIAGIDDPSNYIYQSFYQGPLYSAEVWSNGHNFVFFGVTNRIMTNPPLFLELAKSFPHAANTTWEDTVKAWSEGIINKLGYDLGLAHIEFIETKDGFKLVEINARMAGALITPAIDQCTNYDPYGLAVMDALDVVPELPKTRHVQGGHSHISLYAEELGTLQAVDGLQALDDFPGDVGWIQSKEICTEITDTSTYRSRIGNIFATGPSADIAQDRAMAAAAAITVRIE